jgi:nicotinamide-nucleotide adenylyltransferase
MTPTMILRRLAMTRKYSTQLQSFTSSADTFQVLNPSSRPSNNGPLYILDSSFNPPTNAHLALALSSLPSKTKATVLLLLGIQNADKQPKPASFDHRLEMMALLAHKIETQSPTTAALIALSRHPRFVDKARDVSQSFPGVEEVVWLVGFDTLIRILDKKYYVPKTVEESLREFWTKNRFVYAIRGDDETERTYLNRIRSGGVEGVPPLWAEHITMIEPVGKDASSTRAREAAGRGHWDEVARVVPDEIAEYIRKEGLYTSNA